MTTEYNSEKYNIKHIHKSFKTFLNIPIYTGHRGDVLL